MPINVDRQSSYTTLDNVNTVQVGNGGPQGMHRGVMARGAMGRIPMSAQETSSVGYSYGMVHQMIKPSTFAKSIGNGGYHFISTGYTQPDGSPLASIQYSARACMS
jgi:hypothetical protein